MCYLSLSLILIELLMAGLVSITGACATVSSMGAVLVGVCGGIVYILAAKGMLKLKIDDPLDATPVHLFGGIWGLLAPGFFSTKEGVMTAYHRDTDWGVFYGGTGFQLGIQLLGESFFDTCILLMELLKVCGALSRKKPSFPGTGTGLEL